MKRRRYSRVIISSMLIVWLGLGLLQPVHPVVAEGEASAEALITEDVRSGRYSRYIEGTENDHYAGAPVVIDTISERETDQLATYEGESVMFIDQDQTGTLTVDVPQTAYYIIGFEYKIKGENVLPTQLSMTVNGETPFYEMQNLIFEHGWKNPEDTPLDKYGNEIIPQPIKYDDWQTKYLIDSSYRTSLPLMVKLEAGSNTLALTISEGNLLIKSVEIRSQIAVPTYEPGNVVGDAFIEVEAANQLHLRNNSAIRASSSYNVNLLPYSSDKRVLNHIDPDSFKTPGDMIHYQVEVEEAGFYHLGMHYQQDAKADFPVFMNIRVNDALQHDLLKDYPFFYQNNYEHVTLVDDHNDKLTVYLEAGINAISFQISIAPIKAALEEIEQLTSEIQALSLELTNLVGPDVDRFRDIDVNEYIPGVFELMTDWADRMNGIYEEMKTYNKSSGEVGTFSGLRIAEEQLRSLIDNPRELAQRKGELATGTNSVTAYLGNLMQEINDNGMGIDRFYFYQASVDAPKSASWFEKTWGSMKRFMNTFGEQDYDVSNVNEENLQVWVNRPRQYVEIMQRLIDETFTSKTGVKVDLSMMPDQNKLILANAAGEAPDVALGVNYALPFEIGIRGALEDLSQLDGYDDVASDFAPGMLVPATIQGGVYALPDTMNFWVMFYREDILSEMGLPIPNTISDVRSYLPELQRLGMNFFYPTAGMPGMKIFAGTMPLIYQSGGQLYSDTIHKTNLNNNQTIEGVRLLTELFTIYNVPYDVPSFYQQFRDGSIPIGISDYYMYNLILNAAPEIKNVWDIALIPGIENASGEIERWSTGGAESNIMFKDTGKTDAAWAFMTWWSSADTQVAFGNTLQTTYGPEYMWNTANLEAYKELPWKNDHKQVILDQAEWIAEVPRVPGSYLLERELSNAYNAIVLDGENLRTAIDLASKRVNRETERKLEEFGFMVDGVIVEPYPNPELSIRD